MPRRILGCRPQRGRQVVVTFVVSFNISDALVGSWRLLFHSNTLSSSCFGVSFPDSRCYLNMRLIDVHKFPPAEPEDKFTNRRYAILSHVWDQEELTFNDLHDPGRANGLLSADKIRGAQRQAATDGLDSIWIDTLCIDKSSSAELGEAINSMYRWYQNAEVCYVYLADLEGCPRLRDVDLQHGGDTASRRYWGAMFRESRWFRRGWTLQELIAPSKLRFYDKGWNLIGDLRELAITVSDITGIHMSMLQHAKSPEDFSIAQRMCWAAGRETTRYVGSCGDSIPKFPSPMPPPHMPRPASDTH